MITVLITCLPHSHNSKKALDFVQNALTCHKKIQVFFYGDGAYIANALNWQMDTVNIADLWVDLHKQYHIPLPVCVGAALARGISDQVHQKRHHLCTHNLKEGFSLVGLSEFALMIEGSTIVQF